MLARRLPTILPDLSFEEAQNKLIKAFEKCFDAKLILSQLTQIENENLKKILEGN